MKTNTISMAHTDSGLGTPALVYLPGWCGGREVFSPLLAQSARHRRSISVDWRGHGESVGSTADFGSADLLEDTIELVDALGVERFVPVALSHAGWVALEVRRRLGPDRVPAVVLLDWMPLGTPPGFMEALSGLQNPEAWQNVRDQLFSMWASGVADPAVHTYIASMADYNFDMWARAGREISRSFTAEPSPLAAFTDLAETGAPCPTMHLYAQPDDPAFLTAQHDFAAAHPWFRVHHLTAHSHFPSLEAATETAAVLEDFVRGVT